MFIWLKEFGLIYGQILTPSQQRNTNERGGGVCEVLSYNKILSWQKQNGVFLETPPNSLGGFYRKLKLTRKSWPDIITTVYTNNVYLVQQTNVDECNKANLTRFL